MLNQSNSDGSDSGWSPSDHAPIEQDDIPGLMWGVCIIAASVAAGSVYALYALYKLIP